MTRRSVSVVVVALAVAVGLAGCGVPPEPHAQQAEDDSVPYRLLDRDVAPLLPPATDQNRARAALCFVRDDKLAVIEADLDPPADLNAVVDALIEPPENAGVSLRTAVGPPTLVERVRLEAGVADVDLRAAITDLAGDEQLLAVAQLVCTLTNQRGVGSVSFTLDGAAIDVPRGDGSLTSAPVSRDDYGELLS